MKALFFTTILRVFIGIVVLIMNAACSTHRSSTYFDGVNREQFEQILIERTRTTASLDRPVEILHAVPMDYPQEAIDARIEGTVKVEFIVDEAGNVASVTILESPHKILSETAICAIKQWKFKPIIWNGKPTKARMFQPITYKIPE